MSIAASPPMKVRPADYDAFPERFTGCAGTGMYRRDRVRGNGHPERHRRRCESRGIGETRRAGWPRMYEELTAGYHVDPERLINDAIFEVHYDEMVVVTDIDYYSLCEHHLLPFLGKAHVALHPQRQGDRAEQDSAHRGNVRPAAATAGAHDPANRRVRERHAASAGRGRGRGRRAYVRGDARREKGQCAHGHQRHARHVQDQPTTRSEFFAHIGREHVGF